MGAIAKDRFIKGLVSVPGDRGMNGRFRSPLKQALYQSQMLPNSQLINVEINEEAAVRLYDQLREYVAVRGYYPGKYLRPWEIDEQLYPDLDPNQPWWGFEFETGYKNASTRGEIIRRVWNEMNNMCFDAEGEGGAQCEITFAPQELSKFEDRSAEAIKFMRLMDEMRATHIQKDDEVTNVGTHINVSVPGLDAENYQAIQQIMNNTLMMLPEYLPDTDGRNTRLEFFGRAKLYGLFYGHQAYGERLPDGQWNAEGKLYHWLEGKLFRTTYHYARFEQYLAVCDAITRCMEWLVKQDKKVLNRIRNRSQVRMIPDRDQGYDEHGNWAVMTIQRGTSGSYFDNFVQMVLDGAEPQIANWSDAEEVAEDGSASLVKPFRVRSVPVESEEVRPAVATEAA